VELIRRHSSAQTHHGRVGGHLAQKLERRDVQRTGESVNAFNLPVHVQGRHTGVGQTVCGGVAAVQHHRCRLKGVILVVERLFGNPHTLWWWQGDTRRVGRGRCMRSGRCDGCGQVSGHGHLVTGRGNKGTWADIVVRRWQAHVGSWEVGRAWVTRYEGGRS
jgi:hypothetical protein